MDKLYQIGLLFLNFTILNIFLSLLLFIISYLARNIITSMYIKSRLFFISLMAPPAAASFTIFTSFIPPFFVKPHGGTMPCLNEPYCNIFSFIPEFPLFKVVITASVLLTLASSLYSVVSLGRYLRMRQIIRNLPDFLSEDTSPEPAISLSKGLTPPLRDMDYWAGKLCIRIVDTPLMFSFVWGYLKGIIVISTGALKSLTPNELECLFAHEDSHYRRRDNILKGVLFLCRNTLIVFPHAHVLFRWWREEIELIGDDAALLKTGKPMDIASAILKMQKDSDISAALKLGQFSAGFITPLNKNVLTRRVERLIAIHDTKITPRSKSFSLIPSEISIIAGLTVILPLLFGTIYGIDPLMFHCYLEKLASVL